MIAETLLAVCIIIVIGVLSAVTAIVIGPRKISDDVMQQTFGDVPHMGAGE